MKRLACVAGILFLAGAAPAFACPSPLTGKDAAGTTQNFGVTLDGSSNCYGNIAIVDGSNAANKATVTAANALKVDGSAVTQPISGTLTANQGTSPWVANVSQFGGSAVVTGTGVSGAGIPRVTVSSDSNVLATQSGNWTARVVGNAGGVFDFAGQNAGQPANAILIGGEFNTTPTTLVSPAASPLQLDSSGNLLVNVKVGGGTGGTSSSFGAAFPGTGTAIGVKNGANMVNLAADGSSNLLVNCAVGCGASGFADLGAFSLGVSNVNVMAGIYEASPAPVASGQGAAAMITANRALFVNHRDSAGQELGASLPGQVNTAVRTSPAPALTVPTATVLQPFDQMGQPRAAAMITDGKHYAGVAASGFPADQTQSAVVVRNPDIGTISDPIYGGAGNATDISIAKGIYLAATSPVPAGTNLIGSVSIAQGGNTASVNASNQLSVNCAAGCSGGTFNNNSDAVATSATNGQTAAWLYGFNGTTFDRLRVDGSKNLNVNIAANSFGTVTVSGTVTANQGTSPWVDNITQFGGVNISTGTGASGTGIPRVTVSNDSNILVTQSGTWTVQQGTPPWTIQGDSASGAANAGNPVKTGGVFNTTQPTVTTGQTVDAQSTARGALIVATGVDAFSATVSGTVTANQGGAPWAENITQFGGVNISTGTGASGTGIPRVTVSNDSNILATQSGTWTVQPGNTANTTPWLTTINQGGNSATVNASGQLTVNCAAGCSGGPADGAAFSAGVTSIVTGGVYNDAVASLATGTEGTQRLTANRAVHNNLRDSAGQQVGARLPGANNVPMQINQATNLTAYNNTIFPYATDASGSARTASVIYDGQHYADVVAANQVPGPQNGALVVVQSPKLSLQCPFTVGINQTASTQIVTGQTGKFLHICGFGFVSGSAQNVSLVEGTGSTCGTGTGALVGGTTASIAAAANGGLWNMTDRITLPMQKAGDNLCVFQSAAGNVSGTLTYGIF